ncbi:hydrogen peroxide-inducible genes activator [Acidisoma sp. 7E03]
MKNLTLRQFRYFEALARHGHFGRAAAVSAISQPALSMQIRELEESLGVALFERDARRVRLTGTGEEVALRVRTILDAVDELQNVARLSRSGLVGHLRIGIIPTVGPYLLPQLVPRLASQYGGVELQIRETVTPRLIQELEAGQLDAAIVALPVSEPSLTEIALFAENFVLVRPWKDAKKPVPDVEALREMKLLLLEEGHCFRDQALAFCNLQPHLRPARRTLDANSLATLVQMVAAGLGVTLLPEMAVPVETRAARVSIARFGRPQPARTLGMVWRKSSPLADHLVHVAEVVRAAGMEVRPAKTLRSRAALSAR